MNPEDAHREADRQGEAPAPDGGLGKVRVAAITVAAAAAAGAALVLLVRDQMSRHKRDLFSSNVLERLAALGYLATRPASVEAITVLRDYVSWETRPLLRGRAQSILARMEKQLEAPEGASVESAG